MKKILLPFLLLLLLPRPGAAQTSITAENDRAALSFPNQVIFSIDLQSDAEINSVVLEYGVEMITCGEMIAKAFPQFEPASTIQVSWTWEMLQSGSLPPGAQIWWRWRVTDAAANELLTDTQTITWLDDTFDWQVIDEDGVALHWYEGDDDFAADLHTSAVDALDRLSAETGIQSDATIHLYIYATGEDMQAAVLYEPGWTGGQAYAEHNIVIIGISPDSLDWGKDTEAHEITHVLVGHLTFSCLGFVPTWVQEGLAMYGEGGLDEFSQEAFDAAVADNDLYSVRALSGSFSENPDRADISYSESWSLINYLIDVHGKVKLNDLLLALRDGASVDEALLSVYGFDADGLEDAWRAHIGAAPRTETAQNPTASEPTPTFVPTIVPVSSAPQGPAIQPTRDRPLPAGQAPGGQAAEPAAPTETETNSASPLLRIALIAVGAAVVLGLIILLAIAFIAARQGK